MLERCGPVSALSSILSWIALLVLGFSLLYYPAIGRFASEPAGPDWAEALYYSGYVASTLGIGDLVAPTPTLRLLTVVEALGGYTLLGVSITYLVSIY